MAGKENVTEEERIQWALENRCPHCGVPANSSMFQHKQGCKVWKKLRECMWWMPAGYYDDEAEQWVHEYGDYYTSWPNPEDYEG
jgi:hypothetical protein